MDTVFDSHVAYLVGGMPLARGCVPPTAPPPPAPPAPAVPRTPAGLRAALREATGALNDRLAALRRAGGGGRSGFVFVNPRAGPDDGGPRSTRDSALLPPALRATERATAAAAAAAAAGEGGGAGPAAADCAEWRGLFLGAARLAFAPSAGAPDIAHAVAHAPDPPATRAAVRAHYSPLRKIRRRYAPDARLGPLLDALLRELAELRAEPRVGRDTEATLNVVAGSVGPVACTPDEFHALSVFSHCARFPMRVVARAVEHEAACFAEHGWLASADETIARDVGADCAALCDLGTECADIRGALRALWSQPA